MSGYHYPQAWRGAGRQDPKIKEERGTEKQQKVSDNHYMPPKTAAAQVTGTVGAMAQDLQVQNAGFSLSDLIKSHFPNFDNVPGNVRVSERDYTTTSIRQNKKSTTHRVTVTRSVTYSINKPRATSKNTAKSLPPIPRWYQSQSTVRYAQQLQKHMDDSALPRFEEVSEEDE